MSFSSANSFLVSGLLENKQNSAVKISIPLAKSVSKKNTGKLVQSRISISDNKLTKLCSFYSYMIHEPPHVKTNQMACAPSEDSDQPGHPHSLIRVFTVCMKKAWVLSYPLSAQRRLIRLGRCSLIRVFAGRTVISLVLS